MKTYNLHVINGDEQFHISFNSNAPNFIRAYSAFSASCSHMVSGFGDAKSAILYNAVEEADKHGQGSMTYKYQGQLVIINIDAG